MPLGYTLPFGGGMQGRLLVIDDEEDLAATLVRFFSAEGMNVEVARKAADGKKLLAEACFDVVLLDVGLPDQSGFDLARWILSQPDRPGLIFLSGRSDPVDRTIGLEIGADDYVTKPFYGRELLARVRGVMRRTGDAGRARSPAGSSAIAGYKINLTTRIATLPDGTNLCLSLTEAKVLGVLIENAGTPVSRDDLSRKALGRPWEPEERGLDQHIATLRRKLKDGRFGSSLIITVRHVGYMVDDGAS